MNIATALNQKYIPYTTVMLSSLCTNNAEHVDAYLFNSELNENDLSLMKSALSGHDITLISIMVSNDSFTDQMPRNEQWTIEAYYRLLMFDLLPDTVDRLLYLDGDIIVNRSLKDLYNMDFGNKEMFVCDDKGGLNTPDRYGAKHREMFAESYKNGFRYFNSGVLMLNVAMMKKEYRFDLYLDAIKQWNYEMEAPDQDVLNWVHWKNVEFVDYRKYDLFARVAHNQGIDYSVVKEEIAIIHYPGYKPWEAGSFHYDIEKLWWDYAKETCFYPKLLSDFVQSCYRDKNVFNYVSKLRQERDSKRQLLSKTIEALKSFVDVSELKSKLEDNLPEDETITQCDKYYYKQTPFTNMEMSEMENFLFDILTDTKAEDYARKLADEIQELDKSLSAANTLIRRLT